MKSLTTFALCMLLLSGLAFAASIDGKWVSERKMEREGQSFTITQTFDLKAEGNTLTGKMTMAFGDMEPRTMDLKDGKIDGNKFSFVVVLETPNGEFKMNYTGTIEGDTLKGETVREGGQARPFEARRK
jgi:hypothetical protein